MSRSNPGTVQDHVPAPRAPRKDAGLEIGCTELPAKVRELGRLGKRIVAMRVRRHNNATTTYVLSVV